MHRRKTRKKRIEAFRFSPGRIIASKYEVIRRIGRGWEGEVYLLRERSTGIERAGKIFFPHRNPNNKTSTRYAKKLHKLRHCPILIQYLTHEVIAFKGQTVTLLVSDYIEGELLEQFLKRQPGGRLGAFQALHLLHALASGIEGIHNAREYHGDLHSENIIIHRYGLGFELKLIDLFHWNAPRPDNILDDVCDMIRIFYDALGGKQHYARQPQVMKDICMGLKRSLILKRFRTAGQLRLALENLQWEKR